MVRHFSFPRSDDENVDVVIAEPPVRAQGLSLTTWTSGFVLAKVLHKIPVDVSSTAVMPVLELGAGTGIVGLTAAAIWTQKVILTDLPPLLPALDANVRSNESVVKQLVSCGSLDWCSPSILTLQDGTAYHAHKDKAHVILAADTVYSEEHPELISNTVLCWLARTESSRFIITYAMRVAYLDQIRELWELLETGGLESIQEGREEAEGEDWDDELLCEWSVWRWKQTTA
jgi:predicted nicotinamide N-methyase